MICSRPDCGKSGTMRCPTCIKLELVDGSYFCGQDCFKKYWEQHKALHKAARQAVQDSDLHHELPWNFEFTGTMRPYRQSPYREVPRSIPRPDYADDANGTPHSERARAMYLRCLTPEEIEKMRVVCKLGREVLDECAKIVRPGIMTDEIDRVCHEACIARNCYPSPLNYRRFPKSCCTSVNEIICHGIPDGYILKDGDIVNVDVSVYHDGYHADLNETFLVGTVDDESLKLVKTTYECLMKAIAICKPGVAYRDIGQVISKHAQANGLSVVRAYTGHGIHELFHCSPNIPHYAKNKAIGVMKPGHTFTIEPMINVGTFQDKTWPDEWTSATYDGKRSAQFEHTLLITETGVEILTARTPDSPVGPQWFESVLQADGETAVAK